MSRLIVIEGMDGTGKTVLAEKIRKAFPQFEYKKPVPSNGPEGQTADFMIDWMLERLEEVRTGAWYVMDRINLISEEIYGPVCRGKCLIYAHPQKNRTLREFYQLKPIIIYCRPEFGTILDNLRKTDQMDGVLKYAEDLTLTYDNFFRRWLDRGVQNIITYDYEHDSDIYLISDLARRLSR